MKSVFSTKFKIHKKYDLKGSTVDRQASSKEKVWYYWPLRLTNCFEIHVLHLSHKFFRGHTQPLVIIYPWKNFLQKPLVTWYVLVQFLCQYYIVFLKHQITCTCKCFGVPKLQVYGTGNTCMSVYVWLLSWNRNKKNSAFAPPPPPCNFMLLFKLLVRNNKHSNFEWKGGEGKGCGLFCSPECPV